MSGGFARHSLLSTMILSDESQAVPFQKAALEAAMSDGLHFLERIRRSVMIKYLQTIVSGLNRPMRSHHGGAGVRRTTTDGTPVSRCAANGAKQSVNCESHSLKGTFLDWKCRTTDVERRKILGRG
jgi:hypothetical protein